MAGLSRQLPTSPLIERIQNVQALTAPIRRIWHAFDGLARDTLWTAANDVMLTITAMASFLALQSVYRSNTAIYGSFIAMYGVVGPLNSLTFAGPGLALIQRRLRYGDKLNDLVSSFLGVAFLIGLVSSVVAISFGLVFNDLGFAEIALIVISELFFNSFIFVCAMLRQAAVGYPEMIRTKMGAVILKLSAVIMLFFTGQLTILTLALTYVLLYGAYAIWLLLVVLPNDGYDVWFGRPSRQSLRTSAVFAVPLAAASLQQDGDKVALKAFHFDTQVGLYGAAYRVVQFGSLPLRVIGQAAFHRFIPDGEDGRDNYHLRRAAKLTLFMFVIAVVTAVAIYLALPLLSFLLIGDFEEAIEIVPWLLLFLPLIALSGTPMNGLLGLGRATERAVVYVSSAFVSIVLYLTLIPGRGWQGAVMATLGSEIYLAIASWVAVIYYQRLADRSESTSEERLVGQT